MTRKIDQTKKQLSSATDDKKKKKLAKTLLSLRVDLNYILVRSYDIFCLNLSKMHFIQHYPKIKKYVSLFPPEVRKDEPTPTTSEEDLGKTEQAREEIQSWVKSCMEKGELPQEPELHQPSDLQSKTKSKNPKEFGEFKKPVKSKGKSQPVLEEVDAIEQDEFFGEDDGL